VERGAQSGSEDFSLTSVIRTIRRHAGLVIICCVAVAGSALVFSLLQEKRYSATASLLIRDLGLGGGVISDPAREVATTVDLAALADVAARTADDLDQRVSASEIAGNVEVEEQTVSDIVDVVATDPDPEFAARLANSFAGSFVDSRNAADRAAVGAALRRVEAEYSQLAPEVQDSRAGRPLERQIGELRAQKAEQTARVELVQEAGVPTSPSSPKTARNTVFGGLVGLFLGVSLALLLERRRQGRMAEPVEVAESVAPVPRDPVPEQGARMDRGHAPRSGSRVFRDDPEAPAPPQHRS
jgi:succinoglycan biosynthesis transport protein ExoP